MRWIVIRGSDAEARLRLPGPRRCDRMCVESCATGPAIQLDARGPRGVPGGGIRIRLTKKPAPAVRGAASSATEAWLWPRFARPDLPMAEIPASRVQTAREAASSTSMPPQAAPRRSPPARRSWVGALPCRRTSAVTLRWRMGARGRRSAPTDRDEPPVPAIHPERRFPPVLQSPITPGHTEKPAR